MGGPAQPVQPEPQQPAVVGPPGCVFCRRPIDPVDRCPLLPSSHWNCCACEEPVPYVAAPPGPGAIRA